MPAHHVVTLPGDGIGPEIMAPALDVLRAVGEFSFEERVFGGASIDAHGSALTDETLAACRSADAVLLAAVGGPSGTAPTRRRRAPSRACSACARAWGCTPTCARCGRCRLSTAPRR